MAAEFPAQEIGLVASPAEWRFQRFGAGSVEISDLWK
jgi:hypothetical protein